MVHGPSSMVVLSVDVDGDNDRPSVDLTMRSSCPNGKFDTDSYTHSAPKSKIQNSKFEIENLDFPPTLNLQLQHQKRTLHSTTNIQNAGISLLLLIAETSSIHTFTCSHNRLKTLLLEVNHCITNDWITIIIEWTANHHHRPEPLNITYTMRVQYFGALALTASSSSAQGMNTEFVKVREQSIHNMPIETIRCCFDHMFARSES